MRSSITTRKHTEVKSAFNTRVTTSGHLRGMGNSLLNEDSSPGRPKRRFIISLNESCKYIPSLNFRRMRILSNVKHFLILLTNEMRAVRVVL
jgi:hypothetical protein